MIQLYICGVLTMVVASIRVTWKVAGVHGICMARHVAGDEERKDRGANRPMPRVQARVLASGDKHRGSDDSIDYSGEQYSR